MDDPGKFEISENTNNNQVDHTMKRTTSSNDGKRAKAEAILSLLCENSTCDWEWNNVRESYLRELLPIAHSATRKA